ncbi:MAG: hypothetical protein HRT90_02595 [Candidatus Margulisbacteria bacterium]|nr:hypothetical protein [Candidatus Margulisiibacteriota bacterium]
MALAAVQTGARTSIGITRRAGRRVGRRYRFNSTIVPPNARVGYTPPKVTNGFKVNKNAVCLLEKSNNVLASQLANGSLFISKSGFPKGNCITDTKGWYVTPPLHVLKDDHPLNQKFVFVVKLSSDKEPRIISFEKISNSGQRMKAINYTFNVRKNGVEFHLSPTENNNDGRSIFVDLKTGAMTVSQLIEDNDKDYANGVRIYPNGNQERFSRMLYSTLKENNFKLEGATGENPLNLWGN